MKDNTPQDINGDALRGHLETLILSILDQGVAHGFEILKRLEKETGGALKLKEGSLYPALYRLEEAGMIKGGWEEDNDRRGPRRRIYQITKRGTADLAKRRDGWRAFVNVIGRIIEA